MEGLVDGISLKKGAFRLGVTRWAPLHEAYVRLCEPCMGETSHLEIPA